MITIPALLHPPSKHPEHPSEHQKEGTSPLFSTLTSVVTDCDRDPGRRGGGEEVCPSHLRNRGKQGCGTQERTGQPPCRLSPSWARMKEWSFSLKERKAIPSQRQKSGALSQTVNSRGKNVKMFPRVMEKPVAEIRYHLENPETLQGQEQGRGATQRLRNQPH